MPVYPTSYSPLLGFLRLSIETLENVPAHVVLLPLCRLSDYAMGILATKKKREGAVKPPPAVMQSCD